jgi:hypothetical protein
MTKPVRPTPDPLRIHPGLYRAQLSCKIARDAIDGTRHQPLPYCTATEYALFNLCHAVEEIATAMMEERTHTQNNMPANANANQESDK